MLSYFVRITEWFSSIPCTQPVLGRLVKRAATSMEEYQSKKTLLPRLTAENVVTAEDEEALSSALGGTTRLIQRKGSHSGSHCGTSETGSLPPSSPQDPSSPSLSRMGGSPPPQHPVNNPTTTLVNTSSPIDSPRTEWQNSWGQGSQNVVYPYSVYPTNLESPQWSTAMDATAANWYNAQPIQFHDHTPAPLHPQPAQPHYQQPEYVDVTMGGVLPSFGQTSSVLSGAMYSYPPQQAAPPNNAHAHWQNLYEEMGANYP